MNEPTLLFSALLSILCAGIYYYVGRVLSRRTSSSPDSRLAWQMFVLWWYALAASNISTATQNSLGAFGITDLPLFTTAVIVNLLITCIALFGLMFYLLYLFSGSRQWLGPLSAFYIGYYIFLIYFVLASDPVGVVVEPWRTRLAYQVEMSSPWVVVLLLLLLFPQIIGSLAYFMLYFQVKTATQKYRILLVSWSIVIWFLSSFVANISGLIQLGWWQVLSRLIGLTAALTILMAYQPPISIKRRFGVTSIAEEAS
jgi:hypothetical protein